VARLGTVALALLIVGSLTALAQPTKVHRIGYLSLGTKPEAPQTALGAELAQLGYIEGGNLVLEQRYAAGDPKRLERFAAELAGLKLDVIIAAATPAAQAAQKATRTIPIVFVVVVDPVGARLVSNLARPGGNVTGISLLSAELGAKRLELLREMLPALSMIAVLHNPGNASNALQLRELESAATRQGLRLEAVAAQQPAAIESGLKTAIKGGAGALIVLDDPVLGAPAQRRQLAALVQSHRMPAASGIAAFADAGFLVTYGPSFVHQFRRAAGYADRIIKGARPADLPVEQPSEFELVINLKSARALNVTVPHSVLLRASRLIE
jgi:putative ABC transport system substrate-binding protein